MTRKGKKFAVKSLIKHKVQRQGKINAVMRERNITDMLSEHRNFVDFFGTCQDESNLYFILEYCPNGTLADAIKSMRTLPLELVKNYTA